MKGDAQPLIKFFDGSDGYDKRLNIPPYQRNYDWKEVLREAMNRGYTIILFRENGFPKLYKPVGEAFDACAAGLLLQISPWEFHMEKKVITRAQCLHLNAMAERIADNG